MRCHTLFAFVATAFSGGTWIQDDARGDMSSLGHPFSGWSIAPEEASSHLFTIRIDGSESCLNQIAGFAFR